MCLSISASSGNFNDNSKALVGALHGYAKAHSPGVAGPRRTRYDTRGPGRCDSVPSTNSGRAVPRAARLSVRFRDAPDALPIVNTPVITRSVD